MTASSPIPVKKTVPPCMEACPAGVDVPRYIRAVRDKNYDEALAILREKLPLPTVCADACFAPCEEVCAYKQFGDPIAIRAIKRAAVDRGSDIWKKRKRRHSQSGKKVAVVGAGPAGLTTAYYLITKGHEVTVFDSFPRPGGTLRYGIPSYRLPEERLDKDIQDILEWGVVFQGNTTVGKDVSMLHLRKTYDAVFLATGANKTAKIVLEGNEKQGVFWGLEFLQDVKLRRKTRVEGGVIVIGGGNVAIDVALTAKRLGAKEVHIFCLERREEMPAHEWEIKRAEEEGVLIHNGWAPKKVLGEGRVTGLGVIRCTAVFDVEGNFHPTYDEEIADEHHAGTIILAVGQVSNLDFLGPCKGISNEKSRIQVNQESLSTGAEGVFAGGDAVTGSDSIIAAVGHGRRAASSIDLYLGGDGNITEVLAEPEECVPLPEFTIEVKPRNDMALLEPAERELDFGQVELGLANEQIEVECRRCLNCDARRFDVIVKAEFCKECGYCAEVCGLGTFGPADHFNARGYRPQEVKSSERCVGCGKCFFACPDFAIEVREVVR